MNMDIAMQTFLVESADLLQEMENCLLNIVTGSDNQEAVNSIFRAAHTIKGSAGLFGLDVLVEFTHHVETILNDARAGRRDFDDDLVGLMLQCKDCIGRLMGSIASGTINEQADDTLVRKHLMDKLLALTGTGGGTTAAGIPVPVAPAADTVKRIDNGDDTVATANWHLSVHFGPDVLRDGMDPLSFIRYLGTIGTIRHLETLTQAVPPAAEMDPETCYLGFEINFQSDASKETIEKVFEFVQHDCKLAIMPPHAKVADYIKLIEGFTSDELKLGEILVRCGTLTRRELDLLLSMQYGTGADEGERKKLGELVVEGGLASPDVVIAALNKQMQGKNNVEQKAQTIRVDAGKLDHLINLIGELVIAGASVETDSKAVHAGNNLRESTANMMRLIEAVRESALNLRMVQIGDTFNRFQRVVRDVSKELGKSIELVIQGGDTELDKTVVEKISDPLMHLVRNSIDHGIEAPALRAERGKSETGLLMLNAFHESGSIVIEVSDDGGGLNTAKILAKAISQGLVKPDAELGEHQIHQLIFEPGFSTADKVSNISGRGVGMDVVRRNIEALRGSIEILSTLNVGTTMRIRLPLTLAIIDGFMMKVGGCSYVVPLDIVEECLEIDDRSMGGPDKTYLNLRGEALPFIRLGEYFSYGAQNGKRENIVVIKYGSHKAGLVVDELIGEFQTVIKPMGSLLDQLSGISGSTILGSGEVALILDAPALIQRAIHREDARTPGTSRPAVLH
ncbi:MAG TPA: chemotaxis protein CheA [Candidatus Acidoferrum sp.]|nr:chemotaxis protein CheA [Candidatus Acidoferrum sp.]